MSCVNKVLLSSRSETTDATPSTGLRHPSFNKHWFTTSFLQQALVYDILPSTSTGLRQPSFNKHWFMTSFLQQALFTTAFLQQALVYDILPSTSTGLRHPSFNKHWFMTSFFQQALVYDILPSLGGSVGKRCRSECVTDALVARVVLNS